MGCSNAGLKNGSSHYNSGSAGVWAEGLALQIGSGGVLFFTGYNWGGWDEIMGITNDLSLESGYRVLAILGIVHIVLAVVVSICVLVTVFASSCFTCLLHIVNVINSLYCIACTAVIGVYLYQGYHTANQVFENMWHPDEYEPVDQTGTNYKMYRLAKGRMLLGAVFSLAALAPFSRAPTTKESDPTPEVILYINSLVLCLCLGVTLILPMDVYETIIIGGVWLAVTAIIAAIQTLFSCCSRVATAAVVGTCFVCVAVYAAITLAFLGVYYEAGRDVTTRVAKPDIGGLSPYELDMVLVAAMPPEDRKYFTMFQCTDEGSFLLAGIIMGFALFIVALFAGVYHLRAACGEHNIRDEVADRMDEASTRLNRMSSPTNDSLSNGDSLSDALATADVPSTTARV
eukprot:GHVS01103246.1.p1 GENE.GHVS01103246.1~~GHVS01103246.1.p1  ORF type:complete len:401 (-),score=39.19 GHVS01103246.1:177-1379(-)